ncbi:MAG: hypothetical protein D3904_15585 [Candidatus Electrothrix sp. EH2]|nr:hypothetical protein [Candidatus Electrothrix sp. EH2]
MSKKQKISEQYIILKDCIVYNQLYGLNYPEEDQTSHDKEYQKIVELLNDLKGRIGKNEYKLKQLDFAFKEIVDAFSLLSKGENGARKLEDAIGYINKSKKSKAPKISFISGPEGIIKI